jgi:cold-inducible RNA-binding protein
LLGRHDDLSLGPESYSRVVMSFTRNFTVGRKLYVGNLTYNVTNSDLEALFAPYGVVESSQVIMDRETNRSKGFGFVEMSSDGEAKSAINALHETEHDGRRLTVNEAKPREERSGGGGGGGYGGSRGGGYGNRRS